ncbi:MAG: SdrD B-like domain-containing protein [Actinomycetota bacterium]
MTTSAPRRWIRSLTASVVATTLLASVLSGVALADGSETLGPPSTPIAAGNGVLAAGTGAVAGGPSQISLAVPAGVTIEQVLLYWEGQHSRLDGTGSDADVSVDGNAVTGALIGGPTFFFNRARQAHHTSTYRADITALGLITPGTTNTITIDDLDFDRVSSGAGILVITSDGGPAAEVTVVDGNDAAWVNFDAPLDSTVPQTFEFAPATTDRTMDLTLFVSGVAILDGTPRGTTIEVTVGGTTQRLHGLLGSGDGFEWDTLTLAVPVPAGERSVTVQVLSFDVDTARDRPASLIWNAAVGVIQPEVLPEPGIDIEKLTNGYQADGPDHADVPLITPGDPITWTYVVTNTGEVAFDRADVVVTDDRIGDVSAGLVAITDAGADGVLAPGEQWFFEATGIAADLSSPSGAAEVRTLDGCRAAADGGPETRPVYRNVGTVTVPGAMDRDLSHYCNPLRPAVASLGDRVFKDRNRNGVHDAGEPGVAGATVTLWTAEADGTPIAPVGTRLTAADGSYRFDGLTPGQPYVVQVAAPPRLELTMADAGSDDSVDSDVDPSSGLTAAIVLTPGQAEYSIDAGLVHVRPVTRVEAEQLTLHDLTIESIGGASAGRGVAARPGGTGKAAYVFDGPAGTYDLVTEYWDEADGEAVFHLMVDGRLVDNWIADRELGSNDPTAATLTGRTTRGVTLRPGSIISWRPKAHAGDGARLDAATLTLTSAAGSEPAGPAVPATPATPQADPAPTTDSSPTTDTDPAPTTSTTATTVASESSTTQAPAPSTTATTATTATTVPDTAPTSAPVTSDGPTQTSGPSGAPAPPVDRRSVDVVSAPATTAASTTEVGGVEELSAAAPAAPEVGGLVEGAVDGSPWAEALIGLALVAGLTVVGTGRRRSRRARIG